MANNKEKTKYNLLTQKLLAEGYTAENFPKDKVHIAYGCYSKNGNPLDNIYGGFEYNRQYVHDKAFRTPCGRICKGTSCMSSLCMEGKEWNFENDMATIHCPYHKCDCDKKDSRLPQEGVLRDLCNVRMTDEEYKYDGSVENILKLQEDKIHREKLSFILQHNSHVCENHMHYNQDTGEWKMKYDPGVCARLRCNGNPHSIGERSICPVLDRELCREKGNVYYDIKITFQREDLDGTLFEGQIDTHIEKGVRVFKHPVNMDICRNYAKLCQDEIKWKVKMNYHDQLFFAKYYGKEFSVEVLNIRAEQKESRDLLQDLQDIKAGITITHTSDLEKHNKEMKRKKRQQAQQKKIEKLEKKLLEVGYWNIAPHSLDRIHADKWLGEERINELEQIRKQQLKEEQEKPVQLSLFDLI